jgi:hypothetical protein
MTGQSADFERQNLPNHPIDIGSFRFAETSEASTQRALQPSFPSGHYRIIYCLRSATLSLSSDIESPLSETRFFVITNDALSCVCRGNTSNSNSDRHRSVVWQLTMVLHTSQSSLERDLLSIYPLLYVQN